MKTVRGLLIACALAAFSTAVIAEESSIYIGGSYSKMEYSEDVPYTGVADVDLDFATVGGLAGINFTDYFAIEVRGAVSQKDDRYYGETVKVDKTLSVFTKYTLASEASVNPYVILGYSKIWLEVGDYWEDDDTDFSYGAGLEFDVSDNFSVRVEYAVLYDKDDAELGAATAMAVYTF